MPSETTLKKYGLTLELWKELYEKKNKCCWICGNPFESEKNDGVILRRSYVDHEHVKGFKNMEPKEKHKYVRGILCFQCNRLIVQKSNTLERLEKAAHYLRNYETKKGLREYIELARSSEQVEDNPNHCSNEE